MSYRIAYDTGAGKYEIIPQRKSRLPVLTAAALTGFLLLTHLFWPAGDAALRDFLIPGEDDVTLRAVQTMARELRCGAPFSDTVENFCREIIENAKASD